RTNFYFKTMKNTEGVPYGRGLEVPESSVLSVVLILLAIANIVTNKKNNPIELYAPPDYFYQLNAVY
ncbi:MAG: hypothetical protein J6J37_01665, partial [Bacteroidaceae bacterium]|nr:hypothetical protein [Bacteroidaceae bacterium]